MTQIESARASTITDEMRYVARREDLEADMVRDEVARGRMVIPANVVHLQAAGANGHRRGLRLQD